MASPLLNGSPKAAAPDKATWVGRIILLALIAYGSLYPLTWNFDTPQDFIVSGRIGLADLVENIVLFLPLGILLAWQCHAQRRRWTAFLSWFVISLIFAAALQWLQKYLPRTPALSDIVFNMIGFVAGWLLGGMTANAFVRLSDRHAAAQHLDRFALTMFALWLVAELFPLIPTLDVSSVVDNVKTLWQLPLWEPRRILVHLGMAVIGFDALAMSMRSLAFERQVRPMAAIVVLGALAGKFFIVGQSPGVAAPAGIVIGALLWRVIDGWPALRRDSALLAIAFATYLVHALWPLNWDSSPSSMYWLPFASSLSTSIEATITSVALECLCFGAILWAAVRVGARLPGMTIALALLAFACEWAQRYLPGRTAEITAVFLVLGMGWLLASTTRRPTRRA